MDMCNCFRKLTTFISLFFLISISAWGETYYFTGADLINPTLWSVLDNWNTSADGTGTTPTSLLNTDDIIIPVGQTVTVDTDADILSIENNGTLIFNDSCSSFTATAKTNGNGSTVIYDGATALLWGTDYANLKIESGTSITLGASDITIATGSSLENNGTIVYTDTGRIKQGTGGTVLNDTNGTVEYSTGSGTISPVAYGNLKISSGTWEWAAASASPSPSVANLTATGGTFKITAPFYYANALDLSATSVELSSTLSSDAGITVANVTVDGTVEITGSSITQTTGTIQAAGNNADNLTLKTSGILSLNQLGTSTNSFASITIDSDTTALSFTSTRTIYSANLELKGTSVSANDLTYDGNLQIDTAGSSTLSNIEAKTITYTQTPSACNYKNSISLTDSATDFVIDYAATLIGNTQFTSANKFILNAAGDISGTYDLELSGTNGIELQKDLGTSSSALGIITLKNDTEVTDSVSVYSSSLQLADGITLSAAGSGDLTVNADLNTLGELENNISLNAEKDVGAGGNISGSGELIFTGTNDQNFTPSSGSSYVKIKENKTSGALTVNADLNATSFTISNGVTTEFTQAATITTFTDSVAAGNIAFSGNTTIDTDTTFTTTGSINFTDNSTINGSVENNASITIDAGKTLSITGDFDDSTGSFTGSGTLSFEGTGNQIFTPNTSITYQNIKEDKISGTLTINDELTAGTFTISNGTTTAFSQAATITTFTDSAAAGNITFYDNTTIAANTTFATTGTVTFGDNSGTTASPQEYTFGTSPSYASFTHSSGTTKINGCVKINASNITTGTISATTDSSDELYLVSSSGSFSTGQIGDSGTEIKKLTFDSGASDISFNGSSSTLYADTINFITSGSISLLNLTALSELNLDTTNIVSLSNITIPSLSFIQAPSSINLSGTITVNGTAGLTLSNSVNLTGNTTITTQNGPLSLYDNISGSSYTLIITNSDTFTLNDATNDSDPTEITSTPSSALSVSSFTQNGTGPVSISGDISATSAISFASALTLTGNVNFSADTITLNNSISGTGNTYLASTSGTTLNGTSTIGATSVEVTGPLYTDTSANITVNSPLTAHGNFTNNGTVSASTTSDITVKGDFTDNGIWQSTHKLIFNSTDDQSFKPNSSTTYFKIDETKTAGTLTVTADLNAGTFTITNGTTTTFAQNATINTLTDSTSAGNITFSGDTTIGTDTTFDTTDTVTFSQTSSCQNLTHTEGVTSITGTLNAATVTLANTTFTGTITTTGNQNYTGTVSGGEMNFTGADITFNNKVSSAALTIANSGKLTISDIVNDSDTSDFDIECTNFTQNDTGPVSISGDISATGDISFAGAITLTGNVKLNSGNNVSFASAINDSAAGTNDLLITTSTDTTFANSVGNTSALKDIKIISTTVKSTGTANIFNTNNFTVTGNLSTTSGSATFYTPINVSGELSTTAGTSTTLSQSSTVGSISNAGNLTINDNCTVNGSMTNTGDSTDAVTNNSTIYIAGNLDDYYGKWKTGAGTILFNGTSDQSFTPKADTTYTDIQETKTAGTLTVTTDLNAGTFTITNGTTTTFAQNATINTLTDSTSAGNITFSGDTTIGTDTTFDTTGTVKFSQTSSCQNLTHEAGVTSITGTLNAATVTLGTTTFTGTITTTGNQNYTGTVSGGAMNFTGAAITFNNTVNSSAAITITNSDILTISDIVNDSDTSDFDIECSSFTQSGTGPVSISGDISATGNISFAGEMTLTGNVKLNSGNNVSFASAINDSAGTNNFSLSAVNISFKDDVTAGGTISVEISEFFKTDDGKNISFGTGFTQTGTGITMLGGNFTGIADASFESNLYLYGSNSQFGNAGQTITTDANIVIAKAAAANTLNINAITTCKNFVLYNGAVTLNDNLTTTEDCILLSSNYSVKDEQTNLDNIYTYSNRPTGWSQPNYNSGAWESSYPDTTAAWPVSGTNFGGKLTVADGKEISVGKNFYSNGITLSGTPGAANWYINILDNTNPANCFAEAYNTNVSNCTVRCKDDDSADGSKSQIVFEPGEHNGICNANCQNFDTQTFTITNARTERDNAIYIEFNRPARASITTTKLWNLSYSVASTATDPAFTGIFSDTDFQTPQDSDSSNFYLRAKDTWNTDATGTDAGKTESTDRKGIHKTNVPYLRVPRSTADSHYIITDRFGKRLQNYTEVTSNTYTSIPDYTGPVLYSVRTGQENHTPYDNTKGASSQPSYDSHNFIEFRYSEEVNFGTPSASSTDIWLAASDVTFTDGIPDITNICVNDNFGALSNTNLTDEADLSITGLGKLEKGKIYTGSNGSPDRYVNALYRTDKYSIRLSIAGLTDGTVLDRDGNTYKKWKGYIEQAIIPTGTINILTNSGNSNTLVTDCALALDGTTPLYNPQKLYSSNMTIPEVNKITSDGSDYPDEGIYGNWDISEPVFAPLRLKSSIAWNECSPTDESFYEAVGNTSGAGSTLDRIEFHFFDNTPDYDSDPFAWLTEKGWCFSSSENAETLYDENYTYCADIIGGSRGFSADSDNRTTGGIRYSTIAQLNSSFKYIDNQFDNSEITKDFVSGVNGVFIGAKAPLFVGSSPLRRSATNVDGLYFSLQLSESNYPLIQAFKVSYDDTTGFVTDLAGNRLRSAKIKTIDRTPPTIDFILGPLNQNELYMAFVKELVTKSDSISYMDENGTAYGISETFENLIPKCFEIFSIDENGTPTASEELQIDYSIPAVIENIESKVNGQPFTIIRLKLTQNITLPRLQNLYIKLKNADDYHEFSQDPITGLNNSRVTFIQDYFGNYMQMYSAHSLSDFAISSINPLYAYDADMNYNDSYFMEHLYSDETWSVHDWNKDQQNYGTLPANHPYGLVADLKDGTPENKSIPYGARLFLSASPTEGSIFQQYNSDFNQNVRIWLPEIENSDFSFMVTEPNPLSNYSTVDSTKLNSESNERILFSIPKEISQGWGPNQQIKFLFGLINSDHQLLRIYNSLYFDVTSGSYKVEQSNSIPLIAFRLTNPNDITSIDLWSFKTRGITEQRGGVTILNNVINVTNGEKVAVKVNMKTQGKLNVMIMTIDGNIVTYLNHGDTSEGEHYYSWDGKNKNGKPVARGMYFIRVTGSGIDETRKVMVVK